MLKLDLSQKILYDYTRVDKRYISTKSKQQEYKRKRFTIN